MINLHPFPPIDCTIQTAPFLDPFMTPKRGTIQRGALHAILTSSILTHVDARRGP